MRWLQRDGWYLFMQISCALCCFEEVLIIYNIYILCIVTVCILLQYVFFKLNVDFDYKRSVEFLYYIFVTLSSSENEKRENIYFFKCFHSIFMRLIFFWSKVLEAF